LGLGLLANGPDLGGGDLQLRVKRGNPGFVDLVFQLSIGLVRHAFVDR